MHLTESGKLSAFPSPFLEKYPLLIVLYCAHLSQGTESSYEKVQIA